ncbi:MAG: hypothetical protein RLY43_1923, partial [Bacteroidota bacterium]
ETFDYIKCMTISPSSDGVVYEAIPNYIILQIQEYIESSQTATTFSKTNKGLNRETITSEVIYYWLIALNIPFECQKWHINRLLTLINICNIKNAPPKKMSRKELASRNAALNAARKNQS